MRCLDATDLVAVHGDHVLRITEVGVLADLQDQLVRPRADRRGARRVGSRCRAAGPGRRAGVAGAGGVRRSGGGDGDAAVLQEDGWVGL